MRNRFYFDEIYDALIAATQESLAKLADWFDRWIIAGSGGARRAWHHRIVWPRVAPRSDG